MGIEAGEGVSEIHGVIFAARCDRTVRALRRLGRRGDAAIGGWLPARADASHTAGQDTHPPSSPVRAAAAVEGTSLRGTIRADGRRVHLLSAAHGYGVVLAPRGVDAKSN
ncbi:hypothetical protein ACWET9_31040 [Streptomyces sp. NPDC004059]